MISPCTYFYKKTSPPFFITVCLLFFSYSALAEPTTDGGLIEGSRIVRVSTLADKGDGSLRAAIKSCGPCLIVFDVSGTIKLQSDLTLSKNHITIAGETAPSPGVVLTGGSLKIRASNISVSHIAVYPGATPDPKVAENRDGISIYGSPTKGNALKNIVLRNVSVGWGVDENIGVQGLVENLRIERALIAQPLRHGGHPKGAHSMNVLLGSTVGRVSILGSVLAGADYRSPRFTQGNRVSFINNFVMGAGRYATQLNTSKHILRSGKIDLISNAYLSGDATKCEKEAIALDQGFLRARPQTQVHMDGNIILPKAGKDCYLLPDQENPELSARPLMTVSDWRIRPAKHLMTEILPYAGSHPLSRNQRDARVIKKIYDRSLTPLDRESDYAALPPMPIIEKQVLIPVASSAIETANDLALVKAWLCQREK